MANTNSLDLELSSSQYASIADVSQTGLDLVGDFTIECWVKFESLPSSGNMMGFVAKHYPNLASGYQLGLLNNGGTYQLQINANQTANDTTRDVFRQTITPSTGVWYHFAVSCDVSEASATTFVFYLDGSSLGNGTAVVSGNISSINDNAQPFVVGRLTDGSGNPIHYLDGLIDEVRVWNDIRTAQEISDNYQTELVGDEAGLVAYYKFNNSALDETANNNDLTLSGSPVYSTDVPFAGAVAGGAWGYKSL